MTRESRTETALMVFADLLHFFFMISPDIFIGSTELLMRTTPYLSCEQV
jgi:hypothetical protein